MAVQKMRPDELLGLNKFNVDDNRPHIKVDRSICATCAGKPCLYICSAVCYKPSQDEGGIQFDYAGCLECGTCRVICRHLGKGGVAAWEYPRATFGISFRYG